MSGSPEPSSGVALPPHAYVPGQTARHPEDWFDAIKASVTPQVPFQELDQSAAWVAGMAYFDAGYFWECHEVLEAVWMRTPDPSPEREMTQAVIQLANARLKLRMDKPRASRRLCDMVDAHLHACRPNDMILGLRVQDVAQWTEHTRSQAIKCNIKHISAQ
jgi:uncharacterized protein